MYMNKRYIGIFISEKKLTLKSSERISDMGYYHFSIKIQDIFINFFAKINLPTFIAKKKLINIK